MRKKWLDIITFITLLTPICFHASAQTAIVKGRLTNGSEVLPAATISLGHKNMLTNHDGDFLFSIKAGTYPFVITHAGYKKLEDTLTITAGETRILTCSLIAADQLGEIVVLGSRSLIQRSNLNTPVPVDKFSARSLTETGQLSITQMLNFSAPSFNVSREILNQAATLRGLDPQHVLILLNGARYHNMAWFYGGGLKGQLGRGSVGNDLNSVPFSAVENVEILRDGASAQHGSDAIAGVINIQLKKSTGKTSIQIHTGQYYEGDGEKFSFGIYRGFSLNKRGFLSVAADYRRLAATNRGGTYEGLVYYNYLANSTNGDSARIKSMDDSTIRARGFDRKTPLENVGNLEQVSTGFLINGSYTFTKRAEIFWTAAYNNRGVWRNGIYRFPKDTATQVIWELYPDGFQPLSTPKTIDITAITGIRGKTRNKWNWNFTGGYGQNELNGKSSNTNNASQYLMGKNAQTSFCTGKNLYKLLTTTTEFTKNVTRLPYYLQSLNTATGIEWRLENYQKMEGEEAAWNNYDTLLKRKQGGAQGDAGNDPKYNVDQSRNVLATFFELEAETRDEFLVNVAARYEYYSDYGSNFAAKFAARYKFAKNFLIRASATNCFRAPSLQQQYTSTVQTGFSTYGGSRIPVLRGLFANNHDITRAFHIPSLTAEKSINMSAGLTATIQKHVNVTADVYWIQIKNRIVQSGDFDTTSSAVKEILDKFPGEKVERVAFFTNAIHTRTGGADIIVSGNWNIRKSNLDVSLTVNFNSTRLFGDIKTSDIIPADTLNTNMLFNIEERTKVEQGQPGSKIILSLNYKNGKSQLIVRNTRFGKTAIAPVYRNPTRVVYESFSPKILTDISFTYSLNAWAKITVGANNVFDVYPDKVKNYDNSNQGIWIYSPDAAPFGFNGGYYFLSMNFNF